MKQLLVIPLLLIAAAVHSQATFNCPDTLMMELPDQSCTWTVQDFSYLVSLDPGSTLSQLPAPDSDLSIQSQWDYEVVLTAENGGNAVSCTFVVRVHMPEGGQQDNFWTAHCYNGKRILNDETYRGSYQIQDLNIVSWWLWDTGLSPSYYSEYEGCDVTLNQHTVRYERTGFPCGEYKLNILNHDNEVRVFVDDELVFQDNNFNLQHYNVYQGFLDENSKVEFEWNEGIGGSLGILDFELVCPSDTVLSAGPGCTAEVPDYRHEPCVGGEVTQSIEPGTVLPIGVYPLKIITTDALGIADSCETNVHVVDLTPPSFSCPSDLVLATNENCEAVLPELLVNNLTDNCSINPQITQIPAVGTILQTDTQIQIIATDDAGNTSECFVQVFLEDQDAPTLICPEDVSVTVDPTCSFQVADFSADLIVSDNCDEDVSITQFPLAGTFISSTDPVEVTIIATDNNNNWTECSFFIHPEDTAAPPLNCPSEIDLSVNSICEAVMPDLTGEVVLGVHCSPTTVFQSPDIGHIFENNSPQEITFNAIDDQNNESTCTTTLNIIDVSAPIIDCPGSIELSLDSNCEAEIPDFTTTIVTDNCDGSLTVVQDVAAGTPIQASTMVTLSAIDLSGNTSSCEISVEVVDQTPPILNCPDGSIIQVNTDCTWTIPDLLSETTVSDNCTSMVQLEQNPQAGTVYQLGETVVVAISAMDEAGNLTMCEVEPVSVDEESPAIDCPADQTVSVNDDCTALVGDWWQETLVSSNCQSLELIQWPPADQAVDNWSGQTVITMEANASNGTSASCSFNITFVDDIIPQIVCQDQIIEASDNCDYVMEDLSDLLTVQNECHSLLITQSPSAGTVFNLSDSPFQIEFIVEDIHGNQTSCSSSIELIDVTPPTLECPDELYFLYLDDQGQAILPDYVPEVEVQELCSQPVQKHQVPVEGTVLNQIGPDQITVQIQDDAGNGSNCDINLLVLDTISPMISVDESFEVILDEFCQYEMEDWSSQLNLSDNYSSSLQIPQTPPQGAVYQGAQTAQMLVQVSDESGNSSSLMIPIELIDETNPVLDCPESVVLGLNSQCETLIPDFSDLVEVQDNCQGEFTWQQSIEVGSWNPLESW
ncbi:MAG: HYR domain-containing protein, partial [Flavobacteriales bacterium]|nr:HYR domain-containing protein [Flavobacteriales bacterium]